jgi:hypothetical protein
VGWRSLPAWPLALRPVANRDRGVGTSAIEALAALDVEAIPHLVFATESHHPPFRRVFIQLDVEPSPLADDRSDFRVEVVDSGAPDGGV